MGDEAGPSATMPVPGRRHVRSRAQGGRLQPQDDPARLERRATRPAQVFIVEHVVPEHNVPHFSKLFDIHMMCWGTGQERNEPQYVHLLEKAGWKPAGCYYPANRRMGIITGVCA